MTRSMGSVETDSADVAGTGFSVLIVVVKPVYRAAGRKVNAPSPVDSSSRAPLHSSDSAPDRLVTTWMKEEIASSWQEIENVSGPIENP